MDSRSSRVLRRLVPALLLGLTFLGLAACVTDPYAGIPGKARNAPIVKSPNYTEEEFTEWMNWRDLVDLFTEEARRGKAPVYVEGRSPSYTYRAVFKPKPTQVWDWQQYFGIVETEFLKRHAEFIGKGYVLYTRHDFNGTQQERRISAFWVLTMGKPEDLKF